MTIKVYKTELPPQSILHERIEPSELSCVCGFSQRKPTTYKAP